MSVSLLHHTLFLSSVCFLNLLINGKRGFAVSTSKKHYPDCVINPKRFKQKKMDIKRNLTQHFDLTANHLEHTVLSQIEMSTESTNKILSSRDRVCPPFPRPPRRLALCSRGARLPLAFLVRPILQLILLRACKVKCTLCATRVYTYFFWV